MLPSMLVVVPCPAWRKSRTVPAMSSSESRRPSTSSWIIALITSLGSYGDFLRASTTP